MVSSLGLVEGWGGGTSGKGKTKERNKEADRLVIPFRVASQSRRRARRRFLTPPVRHISRVSRSAHSPPLPSPLHHLRFAICLEGTVKDGGAAESLGPLPATVRRSPGRMVSKGSRLFDIKRQGVGREEHNHLHTKPVPDIHVPLSMSVLTNRMMHRAGERKRETC
ncbi:hypothetical protein LY76DRAFT_402722 [Colletotrichum caudatum]|nr:hypothetical protein LY76DRAFT_402722 [Colletotrichum caudatum]